VLAAFLGLPDDVYHGDPGYCAVPREDVMAGLQRREFLRAQRAWVAVVDDVPVARLVARLSPGLRDDQGRPVGLLGFFEAVEGPEGKDGALRLLAEGAGWLRAAGAGRIVGPMDGDTWHRHRLNVGPFDDPPFLLEPYNPPYYPEIWDEAGFQVLESWFSRQVDPAAVVAHLEPRAVAARAAGYRLRTLDLGRFTEELRLLYRLSRIIFADNFLYMEIPEEDFLALYTGSRALLDPDLVLFARSPQGEDAGFLFAYPDRFQAVAAMRGSRGLFAKLRFLRHRAETDAVDFKTLGVLPEHRRAGVAALLMHEGHLCAQGKGYQVANHCLLREGNPSGDLDGGAGRVLRRYHLYELPSDP
jgi:GNAT superfamily N-acetyltransferase